MDLLIEVGRYLMVTEPLIVFSALLLFIAGVLYKLYLLPKQCDSIHI